jgi:hypothetical protein
MCSTSFGFTNNKNNIFISFEFFRISLTKLDLLLVIPITKCTNNDINIILALNNIVIVIHNICGTTCK